MPVCQRIGDEAGNCVVSPCSYGGNCHKGNNSEAVLHFVCLFIYGAKDLTQDLTYVLMLCKHSASYYSGLSPVPQLQEQTQPTQRPPRSCRFNLCSIRCLTLYVTAD